MISGWKMPHLPFPRHDRTAHVRFKTSLCTGCGQCVESCRQGVLGLLPLKLHRHIHVDHQEACTGCGRCIRTCADGAVEIRTGASA